MIISQELDLPVLEISFPTSILIETVNMNDQLFMSINYPSTNNTNPDHLFYSAAFLYDFETVNTMKFEYTDIRFAVWDYFTNFSVT